jgi:hypothetical protein
MTRINTAIGKFKANIEKRHGEAKDNPKKFANQVNVFETDSWTCRFVVS